MLDDLLGRTALKERIEELEAEREHLERQLAAEQERRADATTARQEAERRCNRLEDRVAELEDRVERLQDEDEEIPVRRESRTRGDRLGEVLDRLGSVRTGPEGLLTAYVEDGRDLPEAVRAGLGDRAPLVSRAAPCLVVADDAGLVGACLSVPVPPDPFAEWGERARIDRSWFRPSGEFTLALVRSDRFAMGSYDGSDRTAFYGFESDLKSQHSKGGFSQSRFERLRDEQIEDHLDRCHAALAEQTADPLYVVGERSVLGEFETDADELATVDATGEPEAALAEAFAEFWTVRAWGV
jgi:peptide subunit release factor 1 (eRF1)